MMGSGLNASASRLFDAMCGECEGLRVHEDTSFAAARVLDCGVERSGSLEAGLKLARLCLGDQATVGIRQGGGAIPGPVIEVMTDRPAIACLGAQYAGWPVQHGKYFAMASGPMRLCRGREEVLKRLGYSESPSGGAVGVLETDQLPTREVLEQMVQELGLPGGGLRLAVAPTRSLAGTIQVVARSVETVLHKLDELKFDVRCIHSGLGIAPLPPPAKNSMEGIGRTNDAILYGGQVTLWVDCEPEEIERVGPQAPSMASRDFGRPFGTIFREYKYDFYRIDPLLFSPAELTVVNLRDGLSRTFGKTHPEILRQSFA